MGARYDAVFALWPGWGMPGWLRSDGSLLLPRLPSDPFAPRGERTWLHAGGGAGYRTCPWGPTMANGVKVASSSCVFVNRCTTRTPRARRWSATIRRWQRHQTASAHMIAVRSADAIR